MSSACALAVNQTLSFSSEVKEEERIALEKEPSLLSI
jgi:hypothetical protein